MKKSALFIACTLTGVIACAQAPTADSTAQATAPAEETETGGEPTARIARNTELTALHTEPKGLDRSYTDDWIVLVTSFLAAVVGGAALYFEWKTARRTNETALNTKQKAINWITREEILKDLIRHLYRNKVVVCATGWKLQTEGFDRYYPSEEHLLKLKVLPEDLRRDRSMNAPEHHGELHRLEFLFRNYNIEIDVALEHLKTKGMPSAVKEGDFETLEFKSQHLTREICKLMNKIMGETVVDDGYVRDIALAAHKEKLGQEGNRFHDLDNVPPREGVRRNYYDLALGITDELSEDISLEYDVIKLIGFVA